MLLVTTTNAACNPAPTPEHVAGAEGVLVAYWSLLRPWVVRRVGVHGRAAVIDGFGAKFVVPGFVAVDLA